MLVTRVAKTLFRGGGSPVGEPKRACGLTFGISLQQIPPLELNESVGRTITVRLEYPNHDKAAKSCINNIPCLTWLQAPSYQPGAFCLMHTGSQTLQAAQTKHCHPPKFH